jgi:hypothetical protein
VRYRIIVRAFQVKKRTPFLTHAFAGHTQEETQARFDRHLAADVALRALLDDGVCPGEEGECETEAYWEDTETGDRWDLDEDDGGVAAGEAADAEEPADES